MADNLDGDLKISTAHGKVFVFASVIWLTVAAFCHAVANAGGLKGDGTGEAHPVLTRQLLIAGGALLAVLQP